MRNSLLIITLFIFSSFASSENENILFENYCLAVSNADSTFQYYAVVNIREKESDKYKEVCLTGFEIQNIIIIQNKIHYDNYRKIKRKTRRNLKRNFTITDSTLQKRINRINYSVKELEVFSRKFNVDSIVESMSENKDWSLFISDEKEQLMAAHLLFNKGQMMGINECLSGMQLFPIEKF